MVAPFSPLDLPQGEPFLTPDQILLGPRLEPLIHIQSYDDKKFEAFIREWAYLYLQEIQGEYEQVGHFSGAGDMGRDIVAYLPRKEEQQEREFDIYQCKVGRQKFFDNSTAVVRAVHPVCIMNTLPLTSRECEELEALLRRPAGREHCRAQAFLWLSQGVPVEETADLLGVTRQTIYNWVHRFEQREDLALHDRLTDAPRSGRPPAGEGFLDLFIEAAFDYAPSDFGFRGTAWTTPLLCQYLGQFHQLEVSRKTVSRALDRLDLHWKRPRHHLALRPDTWRQSKGGSKLASRTACAL